MGSLEESIPLALPSHSGHDGAAALLESSSLSTPSRYPIWIFAFTCMPYGMSAAFATVVMPYLLRKEGVSVETIGWYTSAAMVPVFTQFLYTPIIDVGLKRRTWLILLTILGALCMTASCFFLSGPFTAQARTNGFLLLIFLGQVFTGLVGNCNGGLMASTLTDGERGRAGGFYNAGNLGGGVIGAGLFIILLDSIPIRWAGILWFFMMVLPALAALVIREPARISRSAREVFRTMIQEVSTTVRSHAGWTGLLFCLSPVGTVALVNCFSALAIDYQATPRMVAFVNGASNGIVSALGSLLGGYVSDRMNRRYAYLLSGILTVIVSLGMAFGPLSPKTYIIGVTLYFFIAGFAYSTYSAVVLESIGKAGHSASTQYSLFLAAGNLAITYVGFLDTRFHHIWGPRAVAGTDGVVNLLGVIALAIVIGWTTKRRAKLQN